MNSRICKSIFKYQFIRVMADRIGVKRETSSNFSLLESCKRIKLEDEKQRVEDQAGEEETRLVRKNVALLMAYSGKGYLGMQRNPGVKTIEEDLLTALLKAGVIFQDQFETPQYTKFQRSCRTDKGVSAAAQIVSLKLGLMDDLVSKLNEYLPEQIRVFAYKRVTRSFNCKIWCDARTYSYMLPTFAFTPVEEVTSEEYRISESVIKRVNEILERYKGTHLFHNFTAGRACDDKSCQRYIIDIECGQPFIREGLEFVVITVKGQSFMLHQIRKMIGLAIAIARGLCSIDTIYKAWCPQRLDLPIAPGLGLVLEKVHYDKYNKRYGSDGMHESLIWDEYEEEIQRFKEKFIYPNIINTEKNEKSMLNWLDTLILHTFDLRNPSAPEAVSTLGQLARSLLKVQQNSKEPMSLPTTTEDIHN